MRTNNLQLRKGSVALLASTLMLFSSCKRDIVTPTDNSSTVQRAVTPKTANLNFSSGTPLNYPVSYAVSTTINGGPGSSLFTTPVSIASDGSNFLWVSDYSKNQILIVANGIVWASFGSGVAGYKDGPASTAQFNHPDGIAFGPDGILYVADQVNHRIRMINYSTNTVSTLAGTGVAGYKDGAPATAQFNFPAGITVDGTGAVYVTDAGNNMVRKITNKNSVATLAGQLTAGSQDGSATAAAFSTPRGIALAPNGTIYVADQFNNKIRKISNGTVTTFAGSGQGLREDGTGTAAAFYHPSALATDSVGNVYVADQFNIAIRMITPAGVVSTLAGGQTFGPKDGVGVNAQFQAPGGITVDSKGKIYIADESEPAIKQLSFTPGVKTLYQGPFISAPGHAGFLYGGDGLTVGTDGSAYVLIADGGNYGTGIDKITPDGQGSSFTSSNIGTFKDGPLNVAQFIGTGGIPSPPPNSTTIYVYPGGLATGPDGSIYLGDGGNNRVRKIAGGAMSTLAGNGLPKDVDGTGNNAGLNNPLAIATDPAGNVYAVCNTTIRKITPAGVVTTVNQIPAALQVASAAIRSIAVDAQGHRFVCNGTNVVYEFPGDNQAAVPYFTGAQDVFKPQSLAVDPKGNLYAASYSFIATITPSKAYSILVGNFISATGYTYTDGPNAQATFSHIDHIAYHNGMLYVLDYSNDALRILDGL